MLSNTYTIIILCVILIFALSQNKCLNLEMFNNKEYQKFPKMTHIQDIELKKLLKITHLLFTQNKINYSMCGGTMLGAIRHKNKIPWDDDADLIIFDKDEDKFKNLDWKKNGCKVDAHWFGYKISFIDGKKAIENGKEQAWNYPFVDIFVMKKENGKYVYTVEENKKYWPKEYLYENEMFPLKLYQFDNLMLYGPNKAYNYLNRTLNPGWETNVKMRYSHIAGGPLKTIEFAMSDYCREKKVRLVNYLWVFGTPNKYSKDDIINKFNKDYVVCFVNNETLPLYVPTIFKKDLDLTNPRWVKYVQKVLFRKHRGKFLELKI